MINELHNTYIILIVQKTCTSQIMNDVDEKKTFDLYEVKKTVDSYILNWLL